MYNRHYKTEGSYEIMIIDTQIYNDYYLSLTLLFILWWHIAHLDVCCRFGKNYLKYHKIYIYKEKFFSIL